MSEYKIIKGTADDFSRMSENVEALIKTSCGAKAVRYFGQLIHGAPWQENESEYAIIALRQRVPVRPTFGAQQQEFVSVGLVHSPADAACRVEADLNECIGQTAGIDVQANGHIKIKGAETEEKQAIADCLVRSWGSAKPVDDVPIKVSILIDGKTRGGAQCDTMAEANSLVTLLTDTIKALPYKFVGEKERGCTESVLNCDEVIYDTINVAAYNTLKQLGYTYHGGQLWKPPVGEAPAYITDLVVPAYITSWDGEGFPPVGCDVEFKSGNRWYPATVTAITEQLIVLKDAHGCEEAKAINLAYLRPGNYEFGLLLNDIKAAINKNNCYTNADELIAKQLLSNGWRKI